MFALASVSPQTAAVSDAPAVPVCQKSKVHAVDARGPVRAQKLNELPNANMFLTVWRFDEHGCEKPAIVRYDIGSAPVRQR
jgi:hypothetical protein